MVCVSMYGVCVAVVVAFSFSDTVSNWVCVSENEWHVSVWCQRYLTENTLQSVNIHIV